MYDTLKYLAISVPIFEDMGNYKDALAAYKNYSHKMDSITMLRFDQKAQTVIDRHNMELQAQQEAREKTKIIWSCVTGIIFLIFIVVILSLLFRSNKTQKDLALEKAKNTELENEKLKAERDKKTLEAENLAHRVEILENESASLKELMTRVRDKRSPKKVESAA